MKISSFIKGLGISAILCLLLPLTTYAAQYGDVLPKVEDGWQRYEFNKPDTDPNIQYHGSSWFMDTTAPTYTGKTSGNSMASKTVGEKIKFDFTGTKLNIRSYLYSGVYHLKIDGVDIGDINSNGKTAYGVTYVNESLTNSRHSVEITVKEPYFWIDSIDIDETGTVISPDTPNPDPEPEPEPTPTGNDALLVIKMISGLEKEFELTAAEIEDFINWYNNRADGNGKEIYMFEKDFNMGPFTARKDYVAFSKIQSFEVMEYTK
ncbi:hypothetical protein P4V64_09870 [Bacillus thuringiensis]|nr:hypothetical protein [Bacillus thuringiensis]